MLLNLAAVAMAPFKLGILFDTFKTYKMIQIKTLADFKRALKVGQLINCTRHIKVGIDPQTGEILTQDEVLPTRVISIVQSNSFAVTTYKLPGGEMRDSWAEFPKSANVECIDNKITFYSEGTLNINKRQRIKMLTYSFPE